MSQSPRIKFILGGLLILGAVIYLIASSTQANAQYFMTVDELQAKGYINEARVVESVLHTRGTRLGAQRVRRELQQKGVGAPAVAEAMARLRDTEEARATLGAARRN